MPLQDLEYFFWFAHPADFQEPVVNQILGLLLVPAKLDAVSSLITDPPLANSVPILNPPLNQPQCNNIFLHNDAISKSCMFYDIHMRRIGCQQATDYEPKINIS